MYCTAQNHTAALCIFDAAPLGETTVEEWVKSIRNAPAPWAELEFENIILTLHSDFVRGLDRPDEVASMWDEIMRGIADLAAKPAKFPRKERFVADVQISHGQSYGVVREGGEAVAIFMLKDDDEWTEIEYFLLWDFTLPCDLLGYGIRFAL